MGYRVIIFVKNIYMAILRIINREKVRLASPPVVLTNILKEGNNREDIPFVDSDALDWVVKESPNAPRKRIKELKLMGDLSRIKLNGNVLSGTETTIKVTFPVRMQGMDYIAKDTDGISEEVYRFKIKSEEGIWSENEGILTFRNRAKVNVVTPAEPPRVEPPQVEEPLRVEIVTIEKKDYVDEVLGCGTAKIKLEVRSNKPISNYPITIHTNSANVGNSMMGVGFDEKVIYKTLQKGRESYVFHITTDGRKQVELSLIPTMTRKDVVGKLDATYFCNTTLIGGGEPYDKDIIRAGLDIHDESKFIDNLTLDTVGYVAGGKQGLNPVLTPSPVAPPPPNGGEGNNRGGGNNLNDNPNKMFNPNLGELR